MGEEEGIFGVIVFYTVTMTVGSMILVVSYGPVLHNTVIAVYVRYVRTRIVDLHVYFVVHMSIKS